jgi:hypothetical protein
MGALCNGCAAELRRVERLCCEQIQMMRRVDEAGAWLIDGFGRPHALPVGEPGEALLLGRSPRCDIAIYEMSVSQLHAEIVYSPRSRGYFLLDRDSTNKTFINGAATDRSWLDDGDRILVGGKVGFVFVDEDRGFASLLPSLASETTPLSTLGNSAALDDSAGDHITLEEAEGGGIARVGEACVQLSLLQYELVKLLLERRNEDADEGKLDTGGFVASKRLLASGLSFETRYVTSANLKSLVRSIRNKFTVAGVLNAIEARQNLGYRLLLR